MRARPIRTGSNNSSAGDGPPQPLFPEPIYKDTSPTISDLYKQQLQLDQQCLQYAQTSDETATEHETSDVNSVIELAVKLSGPICLASYPGTFLFQEVQLRTLIASLALLYYLKVKALYPGQWDKVKRTDLQRIAFQLQPDSTLSERIRHADNRYLLQLASQYLDFFRRGDSNLPYVVGPIAKIFFGGLSLVR